MSESRRKLGESLAQILGDDRIVDDETIIASRSHDYWLIDMQRRLHGTANETPAIVVQAKSEDDVSKLLAYAHANELHVVPFGAGSGVCGGARPTAQEIVLDLSQMNRVLDLNDIALTVTVQPGMIGSEFEAYLNARGYSMGHFPQSIELSSVGGWVATRASGQYSTKYGSIENMLVSLTAVLADGTVVTTKDTPRRSTGPSLNELILGSEGTLAVVTAITYRIHPLPEHESGVAFAFADIHAGLVAIRKIMRAGWKPALLRLYDEKETVRHFGRQHKGTAVLLLASEGPKALVDVELSECSAICAANRGRNLGPTLVSQWREKRYEIPDVHELAATKGVIFDTIEIAANWDQIDALYEDVIASLNEIPGMHTASAHSSHSYGQGTCLYFSFATKKPNWLPRVLLSTATFGRASRFKLAADLPFVVERYEECWNRVMAATVKNGGTISHHHGIGKIRSPWLTTELGAAGVDVLRKIKDALDPESVLNPNTLLPPRS